MKQDQNDNNGTGGEITTPTSNLEDSDNTESSPTSNNEVTFENTDTVVASTDLPSGTTNKVEEMTASEDPIYDDDTYEDNEGEDVPERVEPTSTMETTSSAGTNDMEIITETETVTMDNINFPDEITVPATSDEITSSPEDKTEIIDPTMITDTPRSFPESSGVQDADSTTAGYEDPSDSTNVEEESQSTTVSSTDNESMELTTGSSTDQSAE